MRQPTTRVAQLHLTDRRHELMAVLDRLLPGVTEWAENAALYALIVLFWAFILYFALQSL